MKHRTGGKYSVSGGLILIISLILLFPNPAAARSLYLAADHHSGQFDAWNADPFGIVQYQGTYNLQWSTDPAGIAVHEEWNEAHDSILWSAIFITSEFSPGVEIVDPITLEQLGVSSGPSDLAGIDVHDEDFHVYSVKRMTNQLYIFEYNPVAKTITEINQVSLPDCLQAMGIALDETRELLWVADTAAGLARAYNINTWEQITSFAPIHQPVDIAVDRVRNIVYTVSIIGGAWVPSGTGSNYLSKYDVETGVETYTDMGFPGVGVAVDETWNIVYVTGGAYAGDNLSSWNTQTDPFTKLDDTGVIGNPAGIAIGPGWNPVKLAKNSVIQGTGIHIGQTFTYTITFESTAVDLHEVVITDILPPELDFVSATEGGVYDASSHTVVWELGDIPTGSVTPTLYLDVMVNQNAVPGQTIQNYCQLDCTELPPVSPPEPPLPPTILPDIPVSVDIKPGSCPNPIELKKKGVLPAAILGTEDFDVQEIDFATLRIGRSGVLDLVAPLRFAFEDVATPFEGEPCECHDLNGDGFMDMTLKFDAQAVIETLNLSEVSGETIPLTLTGQLTETAGGTPIIGEDCVWILLKK